jgi:hypothetical protein
VPLHPDVRQFLDAKVRALQARSRRLARLSPELVGIRAGDAPYAVSRAHFDAANRRLAEIDREVVRSMTGLLGLTRQADAAEAVLRRAAVVERGLDRARRAYALFFDLFSQRGTAVAPALAACDEVAADCFRAVRAGFPELLPTPLLKPVSYVDPSFSPATFRRGVMLRRLLGERNPFPMVRIPHERLHSPWGFGVVLHEVGHNLQADLGIWQETEAAVRRRVLEASRDPWLTRVWTRWQKEIFADCAAVLLGGPAAAAGMKDFLAYPAPRVLAFRPLSFHPLPYLRAGILAEIVERVGFPGDARTIRSVWSRLYDRASSSAALPQALVGTARALTSEVVDEIAFQPRRGLAGHRLVDVLPFGAADEGRIRRAAEALGKGQPMPAVPPRFVVGAARYAFERGEAAPDAISRAVTRHLTRPLVAASTARAAA